ncbi:uncharacterized protein MAM_08087 [Metarhizium album ARSEF 1941]|uniref:Transcription factor, FAR1-related protein n=1 Tax=Metarhizium album (strain ARSEF 1941) TaxID=1081103 RepID=A0A0B2WJH2_METAS|nr:uncharacterized protein MAM_08087 [Metarhizium album ARSEF 1941]KHN94078.1 hypothetical protein MAM_08087 [Metarhizium album ARSEF 1941]
MARNEIVRCDLVCSRGGRSYKSTATKQKAHTKKTGCPWKAKAVFCNQHNHEAATPEPLGFPEACDEEGSDADNEDEFENGSRPETEASAALQVAGVSDSTLRLTGD